MNDNVQGATVGSFEKLAGPSKDQVDEATIKTIKRVSRLQKVKYDALRELGFTESQAIELCKVLHPFNTTPS